MALGVRRLIPALLKGLIVYHNNLIVPLNTVIIGTDYVA